MVSTLQSSWIVKFLSRKNDAKVGKELEEPSQPSCHCADNQTELLLVSHLSFTQTSLSAHMKDILGVVEVAPLEAEQKTKKQLKCMYLRHILLHESLVVGCRMGLLVNVAHVAQ